MTELRQITAAVLRQALAQHAPAEGLSYEDITRVELGRVRLTTPTRVLGK